VLEYDEQRIAAVGSRISGRVLDVHVVEGTAVEPGMPLATVESAKLGSVQADLRAIEARSRVARLNSNRKRQLVREGIASKRSAEVASREHAVAKAELQAARQRLRALGGKVKGSEVGQLDLFSPIAGEVVNVNIFRGLAVDPMHTAFTVVDNSQLWVRLAVFEGEIDAISVGDAVEIRAQADTEGVLLTGMVDYVSSMFDPQSHAAQVRVIVPNEDGYLRAGQAVNAVIHAQRAEKEGLSVPREAIVQVDGNPTVFVAQTETTVIPRPIEVGISGPERIEVTGGLAAGDVVVTDGVFALKSELFR
ncbi:MAG: efflux RND transporter periplasmic adaptor subunit, partial [Nannocystaceae bacterium]